MKSAWFELKLTVPATGVDLVCNELAELGCDGVTVEERPLDTFVPPDPDEPTRGPCRIKAYFHTSEDPQALRRQVRDRLSWLAEIVPGLSARLPELRTVRQEDWAEGWKQHFGLLHIGQRLVVKPTWEPYRARPREAVVNLDPGMAFGTGTHETTRLCLEALARTFDAPRPPRRVLDVGTGSGILAIAAAALGAERVLACDIEEEACRVATENAAANGVSAKLEITGRPLSQLEDGFDLVLANILAEENIRLAPELVRRLAPAGVLILSGILRERESLVSKAFEAFSLEGPEISRREEWVCLAYRREA